MRQARDALAARLDRRVQDEGARPLELWWRDDDLEAASPALTACLETLGDLGVAAAFAAIPKTLAETAVAALDGSGSVLFVHGWSHTNHAPPTEKKCEFGAGRPLADRLSEIGRGWERLQGLAGERAVACFVPPWNRIGEDLLAALDRAPVVAVSTFASPKRPAPPAAVPRLDTHVDLIDWRGTGGPISGDALAERILEHDGVDGPVGILSHHRVTDPGAWSMWQPVLRLLCEHPAVRWLTPGEALARVGVEPGERRNG